MISTKAELLVRAAHQLIEDALAVDTTNLELLHERVTTLEERVDAATRETRTLRTIVTGAGGPGDGTLQEIHDWIVPIVRWAAAAFQATTRTERTQLAVGMPIMPIAAPPPPAPRPSTDWPADVHDSYLDDRAYPPVPAADVDVEVSFEELDAVIIEPPAPPAPAAVSAPHRTKADADLRRKRSNRTIPPPAYGRRNELRAVWSTGTVESRTEKELFWRWLADVPEEFRQPAVEVAAGLDAKAAYMWIFHRDRPPRPSARGIRSTPAPAPVSTPPVAAPKTARATPPPVPVAPPAPVAAKPAKPLVAVRPPITSSGVSMFDPKASRLDRRHVTDEDFLEVWAELGDNATFATAAEELGLAEPAARQIWRTLRRQGLVPAPFDEPAPVG